jgi:uncharacterized membrane protein YgdD (TMEM256/DUF423 family)
MANQLESRSVASFLTTGAVLAGVGVALGAFGAHGLKEVLDASALGTFETAVRYQMYHALGIMIIATLGMTPAARRAEPWLRRSCQFLTMGTIIFSGSLYLLVATGMSWLGAVAPLGGLALILGWVCLAVGGLRMRRLPRTAA